MNDDYGLYLFIAACLGSVAIIITCTFTIFRRP